MNLKEKINDFLSDFVILKYSYFITASSLASDLETDIEYKFYIIEKNGNSFHKVFTFLYNNYCFYINESNEKIEDIEVFFIYLEKELNSRGFYRKRNVILETKQKKKDNFILY